VHVTVRLFARLREIAGAPELRRDVPDGSTAQDVWNGLTAEFPPLAGYSRAVSVAVNEEYARLTASVRDGDDIAFLPPVSGGSGSAAARSEWVEC
jgi:molybdopterin converting factor subunit 1